MKINTRQHYVPRFYLKGWCDAKDYLWAYPVEVKPPFQTSVENVACEKGLYTHPMNGPIDPLQTEKMMAEIEGVYAPVWPDICDRAEHPDTKMNIARFLALMTLRHPHHEDHVRQLNEKFLSSIDGLADDEEVHFQLKEQSWTFTAGEVRRHSGLDKDTVKSGFLDYIRTSVEDIASVIAKRKWGIVFSDSPTFLTSDCPVLLHRGKSTKAAFGFGTPSTQVFFPISPVRLLVISDDWPLSFGHYKLAKPDPFNKIITAGAGRFVFFGTNDLSMAQNIKAWREKMGTSHI